MQLWHNNLPNRGLELKKKTTILCEKAQYSEMCPRAPSVARPKDARCSTHETQSLYYLLFKFSCPWITIFGWRRARLRVGLCNQFDVWGDLRGCQISPFIDSLQTISIVHASSLKRKLWSKEDFNHFITGTKGHLMYIYFRCEPIFLATERYAAPDPARTPIFQ